MRNSWKEKYILGLLLLTIVGKVCEAKRRVCIVGAGPSGLISAKYVAAYPDEFQTVVFEKSSDVGGLWIYTDSTTVDEHGLPVHSSMYKYLRTNTPKELSPFPDYPQWNGNSSYVSHENVLQYLRNYTEHYHLRKYIQFNTNVEKIRPLPRMKWRVTSQNLVTDERSTTVCDVIIVGNGINVKGNIPDISGIEKFPGRVLHSHTYRKPEEFANQTVVVLGASYSGLDIGIEITWFAKTVYLSHRNGILNASLPENMIQVPGVVGAANNQLILSNGTRLTADALVLCTGYDFDFPFLDASSGVVLDDGKYVRSIYKNLINIRRPTMAFINLVNPGVQLLTPHAQIQYFIAVLRDEVKLPSQNEMLESAKLPPGTPKNKAHYVAFENYSAYYDELAVAGGGNPLPSYFDPVLTFLLPLFATDPGHYRDKNLYIYDNGTFEYK